MISFFLRRKSSKCKLWRLLVYDSTSNCPKVYIGKVQIKLIITRCDHAITSMSMRQKTFWNLICTVNCHFWSNGTVFTGLFIYFVCLWVREGFVGCCIVFRVLQTIIGGRCHKYNFCCYKKNCRYKHVFCHNKSMLVVTKLLSWRVYFVMTSTCLSWQKYTGHDKTLFARNTCLSRQK